MHGADDCGCGFSQSWFPIRYECTLGLAGQDLVSSDEEACCRAGGRNYCVVEEMDQKGSRSQDSLIGKPNGIYTNGCFTVLKEDVFSAISCSAIRRVVGGRDKWLRHHLPPGQCRAVYDAESEAIHNTGACVWPQPLPNTGWSVWDHNFIGSQKVFVGATKCAKYNGHAPCNFGTEAQRPVPRCRNVYPYVLSCAGRVLHVRAGMVCCSALGSSTGLCCKARAQHDHFV